MAETTRSRKAMQMSDNEAAAQQRTHFEAQRKPKAWNVRHRFLFIHTRVKPQHKDPV